MRRALILCAALLPAPALAQTDDPGILTRFLQDNLSGAGREVRITGFAGALSSRATIQSMTIADGAGVWLTLNGVTLDWNRAAVLRGQFSVNQLTADEIILVRPPEPEPTRPSPEARGFSLPELPISVDIGKVAAARVELGEAVLGVPLEARLEASLKLSGGEGSANLTLSRTDAGPEAEIALEAGYSNATRRLLLDLDAREAAGGIAATKLGLPGLPATALTIKGEGPIDAFAADIRLATDEVDRLTGRVALKTGDDGVQGFTALLGGDPAPLFVPEHAAFFGSDVGIALEGARQPNGVIELTKLSVRTEAMQIDGGLRLGADGMPDRFALTGKIENRDGSAVILPISGTEKTTVGMADLALRFDAAKDDGWSGQATVRAFSRPGLAVDNMLLTGSGRIRNGAGNNLIGATVRMVAAGMRPDDPGLAEALGAAVTGQIKMVWQEGKPLNLSDLTIAGANYTIRTQGDISELTSGLVLDGRIEAEAKDLSRFSTLAGRPLAGRMTAEAKGRGTVLAGDFDLEGTVAGDGLQVSQPELDGLLRGISSIRFSLVRGAEGTDVRQLDIAAANLSVQAKGRIASAGSDLSAELKFDDLRTLGPQYRGSLAGTARLTGTAENGALTLDARAEALGVGQAQADRLLAGSSTLNVALRTEAGAIRVDRFRLMNPQLTAEATGAVEGGVRRVDLSARLADLGAFLPEFPGALTVSGTAVDAGSGYRIDLTGKGPGRIEARVAGRLDADFGRADLTISGTAQAALANPFISPRTVAGPLSYDLRLNGPLALSSLSGRVSLNGGRVAATLFRIGLQAVNAEADLAGGKATISADAAVVAGGRVGLRGTIGLRAPYPGDLTVTLANMVLRDAELYEARVEGEIRISGPLTGGARISGVINVPETEIRVPSTGLSGTAAIPDLRHANEPVPVRDTRARAGLIDQGEREAASLSRPYVLDLTINAPNRVFVRGRGLDAELGGSLRLGGTSENVVPSGAIDLVRGRLDILGQRLKLTEAELRVAGSLDPTLHVVASNESGGITSSVVIDGRISALTVSFVSVPSLPQEEVLAHLLFGQDLSALSPFQAAQLASAVATLAGRGGEGIIARLRKGFGFDDFDVVTGEGGQATLRIGKYIAKDLYSEVTVGTQGTTQLNLNLDLKPGVVVRGSADSQGNTGIGIFVDRDY